VVQDAAKGKIVSMEKLMLMQEKQMVTDSKQNLKLLYRGASYFQC
jgi:hypothetical protein